MSERFLTLPADRQREILSAAFRVFAGADYAHASMAAIADEARISKSLLFHYFTNKWELYLYLWDHAAGLTARAIRASGAFDTGNLFEILRRTTLAKCGVMRRFPYLFAFANRAYYETDPQVSEDIRASVERHADAGEASLLSSIDVSCIRDNFDPAQLYRLFVMTSDGYMLARYREGAVDADRIQREFLAIIDHWEQVYGAETKEEP